MYFRIHTGFSTPKFVTSGIDKIKSSRDHMPNSTYIFKKKMPKHQLTSKWDWRVDISFPLAQVEAERLLYQISGPKLTEVG